jgi:hypothetical protein
MDNLVKLEPINKREDLRPIGSTCMYYYPPDLCCNEQPCFRDVTYRITDHRLAKNEYGTICWAEVLEVVEVKRIPATIQYVDGHMNYIRPEEVKA